MKALAGLFGFFMFFIIPVALPSPIESLIPGHEVLALPEGIKVYFPGQEIRAGIPAKTLTDSKMQELLKRKSPGGEYSVSTTKTISASLGVKVLEMINGGIDKDRVKLSNLNLSNIFKIIGTPDEIFAQHNDATVIQNVLLADVTFELEIKDTTKANIQFIKDKISEKLNANVSGSVYGNDRAEFKASDIVIGIQSVFVRNSNRYKEVVSFASTQNMKIDDKRSIRQILIIPSDKSFKQTSEIGFRTSSDQVTINSPQVGSSNKKVISINIYGTGFPIAFETVLDLDSPKLFATAVPASGRGSSAEMIVYIFDPIINNDGTFRFIVNRTMKSLKKVDSGLAVLSK